MLPVVILFIIYLCLLGYLLTGLLRTRLQQNSRQPAVTVIVAARNEAERLEVCVNAVLQQDYPLDKIEIILVNDRSTDDTGVIMNDYAQRYTFIRVIQITGNPEWKSGKKSALQQACLLAQGEILFFTDADCRPPATWINDTLLLFTDNTGLVAGFSPQYSKGTPTWDGFLKMESLTAALVAAGSIGWQRGVTCTGRNLALRAQTLRDIAGYTRLPNTLSGDDDFLLQQVWRNTSWQCRYSSSPSTHVPAAGPQNMKQYFRQRSRHLSAGKNFSFPQQTGYALYYLGNYGLWLTGIAALWGNYTLLLPLFGKLAADWCLLSVFCHKLHSRFNLRDFIVWQVLFPVLHLAAAPRAFWGKLTWKSTTGDFDA